MLASVSAGFSDAKIVSGIRQGTAMALVPDGRILVAEQGGAIRIVKNGALLSTPLTTLNTKIEGSRGLIGLAVDPGFSSNKYIYVYYTLSAATKKNRLARLTVEGDLLKPGSEKTLWESPALKTVNHNGGAIEFGTDDKLYLALGDDFTVGNAQSLQSPFGKILRFNTDGTIPGDNPWYGTATGSNRAIWARGLRNPFTFAIHRGSGRMFINDVGADAVEEINDGKKGAHYGWDEYEGPAGKPGLTDPFYSYTHAIGASVIGAAFYNPTTQQFPSSFKNDYFFGDYVEGFIKVMDYSTGAPVVSNFASGITQLVDIEFAADGSMFYLERGNSRGSGGVSRITYSAQGVKPAITLQPVDVRVADGNAATFSVSASGTAPLSYQWQRNSADIPGATGSTYILAQSALSDSNATFRCVVRYAFGAATSTSAKLTVVDDEPPSVSFVSPPIDATYRGGGLISFSATAFDAEDGAMPASRFAWEVVFHHDTHMHPFAGPVSGQSGGSVTIPVADEPDPNQWYRIYFTVTDSIGNETTVFRDVHPEVSRVALNSNVPGINLKLDSREVSAGAWRSSIIGASRKIVAPPLQTIGVNSYEFVGWSDGGTATHTIITPESDTVYTAEYRQVLSASKNINASYFSNSDLTGNTLSRGEGQIRFRWENGSPDSVLGTETWSARWESNLIAPLTGPVRLYTYTDDGVRLWIDGQLVLDKWIDQSAREYSAAVNMIAGRKYAMKMEYYDKFGKATAELSWSAAGLSKQIIPAEAFSLEAEPPPITTRTTIAAAGDAMVRNGTHAGVNFGGSSFLEVKKDPAAPDFERESYLWFDISSVSGPLHSARLRINGRLNTTEDASVVAEVLDVLTDWDEATLTWNSRPVALGAMHGPIVISGTEAQWYEVDVTAAVSAARSAGSNRLGLLLRGQAASRSRMVFASRETGAGSLLLVETIST